MSNETRELITWGVYGIVAGLVCLAILAAVLHVAGVTP